MSTFRQVWDISVGVTFARNFEAEQNWVEFELVTDKHMNPQEYIISPSCTICPQDCQDLLRGKEALDAGTEKVLLIKMQRVLSSGMEAAKKLELQVRLRDGSCSEVGASD